MDPEDPASYLMAPSPEELANVKVFPLIPSIKKDVVRTIGAIYFYASGSFFLIATEQILLSAGSEFTASHSQKTYEVIGNSGS